AAEIDRSRLAAALSESRVRLERERDGRLVPGKPRRARRRLAANSREAPVSSGSGALLCLLGFGEREVRAQADHAKTGSRALAAAETGAGLELAFERSGQGDHGEIGGGIQGYREDA